MSKLTVRDVRPYKEADRVRTRIIVEEKRFLRKTRIRLFIGDGTVWHEYMELEGGSISAGWWSRASTSMEMFLSDAQQTAKYNQDAQDEVFKQLKKVSQLGTAVRRLSKTGKKTSDGRPKRQSVTRVDPAAGQDHTVYHTDHGVGGHKTSDRSDFDGFGGGGGFSGGGAGGSWSDSSCDSGSSSSDSGGGSDGGCGGD